MTTFDTIAIQPALSRDPCFRCGVPGAKGCAHQLPFEPAPAPAFRPAQEKSPVSRRTAKGGGSLETQTEASDLREEVMRFLVTHDMSKLQFTTRARLPKRFVVEMMDGTSPSASATEKARKFMAAHG
ncbi:hypothetical protein [Croceicoccus sp. YJ47]|uniref:hypothetical protein n=1 Tax=Croceicoccus sp. YJ47 TaxID=2798724 RepID=UPI00192059D2|nr:hypothetical protein [Croceicoccus sp. YJ47]QQN75030.1 hypothetical protein JD971_04860 [Croceicoccus sp. YJ47]